MNKPIRRICDQCKESYPKHVNMYEGSEVIIGRNRDLFMCSSCTKARHLLYGTEDPIYVWFFVGGDVTFLKIHAAS